MTIATSSVIVVSHNNWPALDLAVASAIGQTRPPSEIIVVDNASTDGSPERISAAFGSRIRVIRQENRLDSGGYNAGIAASTGDVIQLLDGDDLLDPHKLERQIAALDAVPDADIAYGDVTRFREDPSHDGWIDYESRQYDDVLLELCRTGGRAGGFVVHSLLFRRRVIEKVGRFDESIYGADYDYWFRAAAAGCRFVHVPGALVFYRARPGQMSMNRAAMAARSARTFEKALTFISREPCRAMLERHLQRFRLSLTLYGATAAERRNALRALRESRSSTPAVPALWIALGTCAVVAPEWARNALRRVRPGALADIVARG
ncbi:MAG TPA: glycosyltransferase [Gemmatimonadaceae bacterium]|nr:glycosyltransferase [Gemmatimonadaceae bacterium]